MQAANTKGEEAILCGYCVFLGIYALITPGFNLEEASLISNPSTRE